MPYIISKKAPAKVNLLLDILGCRKDGFHEIRSVMQTVDLADTLEIEVVEKPGIVFTCSDSELSDNDNLVVKAYQLFYEKTGLIPLGLNVHLIKQIPVAAGLGGGSSDCASMLMALNEMHQNAVLQNELANMAASLGSDVPFFLTGGTCLITGRGERIQQLLSLPDMSLAMIKPRNLKISAKDAYALVKQHGYKTPSDWNPWESFFKTPDIKTLALLLKNDFDAVLPNAYPQLQEALTTLKQCGIQNPIISGSGPVMFGLLDNPAVQWEAISNAFSADTWWLTKTRFSPSLLSIAQPSTLHFLN